MCAAASVRPPLFSRMFGEHRTGPKAVQVCNRLKPNVDDDDSRWGDRATSPRPASRSCSLLPPRHPEDRKLVVCLDLDETLIHCRLVPRTGCLSTNAEEVDCESCFLLQGNSSVRQLFQRESRRISPLCLNKIICVCETEGWRTVQDFRKLSLRQWADIVNKTVAEMRSQLVVDILQSYEGSDAPAVKAAVRFLLAQGCAEHTLADLPSYLSTAVQDHSSANLSAAVMRFIQRALVENSMDAIRGVVDRCLEQVHSPKPRPLPQPHEKLYAQGKEFNVWLRPNVAKFMQRLGELPVEVVVFTASLPEYADPLVEALDKQGVVKHRLYRDAVQLSSTGMAKDMALLGRPLDRVVLVDNADYAMALNPENGIRVHNFHGYVRDDDDELLRVLRLIEELVDEPDVRPRLREEAQQWAAKEISDPSRLARRFRERVEGRSAVPVSPF